MLPLQKGGSHKKGVYKIVDNSDDKLKDNGNEVVVHKCYESLDALVASNNDFDKEWIMDSSCTSHMTPNMT